MWSGDEKPYEGKHYQLARPLNSPQAVQKPHPPILIGGSGERKTLRLVAQYADACNLFARLGKDQLQHKLDTLRDHCQSVGRPYEQIEKTTLDSFHLTRDGRDGTTTPAQAIEQFAALAAMGIDQAIFNMPNAHDGTTTPAQAIEQFAALAAMGIDQAIFNMPNVHDLEPFDLLATEIVPAVEKIPVAGR